MTVDAYRADRAWYVHRSHYIVDFLLNDFEHASGPSKFWEVECVSSEESAPGDKLLALSSVVEISIPSPQSDRSWKKSILIVSQDRRVAAPLTATELLAMTRCSGSWAYPRGRLALMKK